MALDQATVDTLLAQVESGTPLRKAFVSEGISVPNQVWFRQNHGEDLRESRQRSLHKKADTATLDTIIANTQALEAKLTAQLARVSSRLVKLQAERDSR